MRAAAAELNSDFGLSKARSTPDFLWIIPFAKLCILFILSGGFWFMASERIPRISCGHFSFDSAAVRPFLRRNRKNLEKEKRQGLPEPDEKTSCPRSWRPFENPSPEKNPMFIGVNDMNLIKTLSLAIVGMALVSISSAQSGRNLEREAANAQDRIATAEMNLQNVQRGMAERMDFIRDQNDALQADKKELASFQSGKNKYFGSPERLRELQKSIAQREGDIEKSRITWAELKRAEQKYETQRRSASADLYRINEDIKRDNGGSPGVREVSRVLISTKNTPHGPINVYRVTYSDGSVRTE